MQNLRYLTIGFLSLYLSVLSINGFAQSGHEHKEHKEHNVRHEAKRVAKRILPVAVNSFRVSESSNHQITLNWNSDKISKKFKVDVISTFIKKTIDYSITVGEPQIKLFGLNIANSYVVVVTPINASGQSGPSKRVAIFKSRGKSIGNTVPVFTVATITSTAAESLLNLVGDGSTPNLKLTLIETAVCKWAVGYSVSWGSNIQQAAGIPVRASNDKCGGTTSKWKISDAVTDVYFGDVTLNNDRTNVTFVSYFQPSGGNYVNGLYIIDGGGSYPELHAQTVTCGYCNDNAVLINKIGSDLYPSLHLHLELGNNSENTTTDLTQPASNTYNLDYYDSVSGTPKGYIPNSWSVWNVKNENGDYFGTIGLNRSTNDVTLADPPYNQPSGTEYLSNVQLTLDKTKVPAEATLTATAVACGAVCIGPFPDAPTATAPSNFLLTTSTNQLLLNGNPIRLKGWARPSLEWNLKGQYFSTIDIANMKNSGANVIRISMSAKSWLESDASTVNGSYKQIIDAIVYYAAQNHMMVILDYHKYTNAEGAAQEPMAIKDAGGSSIQFWTEVATKYKGFGNVLFELYNEPVDIAYSTWLNGDASYYGMQDLYKAVRDTGAKNVVVIAGVEWSFYVGFIDETKKLCNGVNCFVKDTSQPDGLAFNAIYNVHPYTVLMTAANPIYLSYKGNNDYTFFDPDGITQPADFKSNFAGIINKYPIMFTEFGARLAKDYEDPTHYGEAVGAMLDEANDLTLGHKGIHIMGWAWWIDAGQPEFPTAIGGQWSNPTALNGGELTFNDYKTNPPTDLSLYLP